MLTTVSKPMRGSSSAKARAALAAVLRSAPPNREVGDDGSSPISYLLDVGPAEDALGQEDHHDRKDREGGSVLVGVRHVFGPERLDHAAQQAAEHCARQRADAAEHRRR